MMETFKAQLEFLYRPLVLSPTSLVLITHCLIFTLLYSKTIHFNMPLHLHQPPILYIYNLKDWTTIFEVFFHGHANSQKP